jgi:NAD(P)-dependent dehydrogenase (short-subunit alcohol dehydrogenase family)
VVTGGSGGLGVEAANRVDPERRATTTATLSSRRRAHGKVTRFPHICLCEPAFLETELTCVSSKPG